MRSGCVMYMKVGPYKMKLYKNKIKRNQIHKNNQRVQAHIILRGISKKLTEEEAITWWQGFELQLDGYPEKGGCLALASQQV